ncbi:MAG: hypothetical protein IID45_13845 [Planctomycetes bacterium]|nr:hypothetical protein [Planctomycetota bacterium]
MSAANRTASTGRWLNALVRRGRVAKIQIQRQWYRLKRANGRKTVVWFFAAATGATALFLMLSGQFVSILDSFTDEDGAAAAKTAEKSPAEIQGRAVISKRVAATNEKKHPPAASAETAP